VVGLSFEAIGGVELRVVEHLLSRKLRAVVASFPRKPRLGEEPLSEEEAELEPGLDEEAALTQEEVSPEAALCDGEIEDLRNTIRSPDRQTLLRKRSRQILIVVGDDLERAALLGNLYGDGYRCVYEARGLVQALERAKKHAVDLFILDQQVGPHTALQILERLRAAGWMTQAKVVVLKEKEDVRLALATKAGGVAMVVPRPLDFHAVLKPGLETLLELA
jgi:CheY-like chemotaxis protein